MIQSPWEHRSQRESAPPAVSDGTESRLSGIRGPGILGTGQEKALPVLGSVVLQAVASENWHKSGTAHSDLAYGSGPHLPAEGRTALRKKKNSEGKPLNFVCYGMHGRGHYCRARVAVWKKML